MNNGKLAAFPQDYKVTDSSLNKNAHIGLSKRELVAAMALQALIGTEKTKAWSQEDKVSEAVFYADLLFKQLEKVN